MCIRRPGSTVFPLVIIMLLVAVVASDFDEGEESNNDSFLERISKFVSSMKRAPRKAPLDKAFQPKGELVYVDLSKMVNKKLSDGTIDINGNTLDEVNTGEQQLAGVKFNVIDGVMQLTSEGREHFPKSINGISVDATFARLYSFHATQGSGDVPDGTLIGKYVVHYEDADQETIPIVVGEDVRDWWNVDRSKKLKRGRVAWVGSNPGVKRFGCSLRLFVSKWENPRPDAKVIGIDYISENVSQAGPFCLAMTLEGPPPVATVSSRRIDLDDSAPPEQR